MNRESSRSHSVFTCVVESKAVDEAGLATMLSARVNLVDLAGQTFFAAHVCLALPARLALVRTLTSWRLPGMVHTLSTDMGMLLATETTSVCM